MSEIYYADDRKVFLELHEIAHLIRNEADKHFTGCDFSVTTRTDAREIKIEWEDGPTTNEVYEIIREYRYHHFWLFSDGSAREVRLIDLYPDYEKKNICNVHSSFGTRMRRKFSYQFIQQASKQFEKDYSVAVILKKGLEKESYRIPKDFLEAFRSEGVKFQNYWAYPKDMRDDPDVNVHELHHEYARLSRHFDNFCQNLSQDIDNPVIEYFEPIPNR